MIRSILLANNHSTGLVTNQIAFTFLRQGTLSGPISSSADSISFVTSISQLPSQSDWKLFAKWIATFQSYQSSHSNLKRWQRRALRSQQNDKWAEYWEIKACKAKRLKTAQNLNIFCAEQNSSYKITYNSQYKQVCYWMPPEVNKFSLVCNKHQMWGAQEDTRRVAKDISQDNNNDHDL